MRIVSEESEAFPVCPVESAESVEYYIKTTTTKEKKSEKNRNKNLKYKKQQGSYSQLYIPIIQLRKRVRRKKKI